MKIELIKRSANGECRWGSYDFTVTTEPSASQENCLMLTVAYTRKRELFSLIKPVIRGSSSVIWFVSVELVGHLSKLERASIFTLNRAMQEFASTYGWDNVSDVLVVTDESFKRSQDAKKLRVDANG